MDAGKWGRTRGSSREENLESGIGNREEKSGSVEAERLAQEKIRVPTPPPICFLGFVGRPGCHSITAVMSEPLFQSRAIRSGRAGKIFAFDTRYESGSTGSCLRKLLLLRVIVAMRFPAGFF